MILSLLSIHFQELVELQALLVQVVHQEPVVAQEHLVQVAHLVHQAHRVQAVHQELVEAQVLQVHQALLL